MSSTTVLRTQSCPRLRVKRSYSLEQIRMLQRKEVAPVALASVSPSFIELSIDVEASAFTYAESSVMSDAIYPSSYPFFYTSLRSIPTLEALATVPDHLPLHVDLLALPMWTEQSYNTPMKSKPLNTWNTTKRWLRTQKRQVANLQLRKRPSFAQLPPVPPVPPAPLTLPSKLCSEQMREPLIPSSRAVKHPLTTSHIPKTYMLGSPSESPKLSYCPSPSTFLNNSSLTSPSPKLNLEYPALPVTSTLIYTRALSKISHYIVVPATLHCQVASDLHLECMLDNMSKSSLIAWQKQFFVAKTEVVKLTQQRQSTKHPIYDVEYEQCTCGLITPVSLDRDRTTPLVCSHVKNVLQVTYTDICPQCASFPCICKYQCDCIYIPGKQELEGISPCFCPYCPFLQAILPLPPLPRGISDLIIPTNTEILVLAGDVIPLTVSANKAVFHALLEYIGIYWKYILFVPGNHEYYHTLPSSQNVIKTKTQSNSQETAPPKYATNMNPVCTSPTDSINNTNTQYSDMYIKMIKKLSTSNTGGLSRSLSQSIAMSDMACITPSASPYMTTVEDTDQWLTLLSNLCDYLHCFMLYTHENTHNQLQNTSKNRLFVYTSLETWCFTGCTLWGDGRVSNTNNTTNHMNIEKEKNPCYCYEQYKIAHIGTRKYTDIPYACICTNIQNNSNDTNHTDKTDYIDSDIEDIPGSTIERSVRDYYACVVQSASSIQKKDTNNNEAYRTLRLYDTTKLHKRSVYKLHHDLHELKQHNIKICIVTHHAPVSNNTSSPEHESSNIVGAFSGKLEWMLPYVQCWIAGHTHWSYALMIQNCFLLSNQRGYSGGECSYDPTLKLQFQPKIQIVHDSAKKKA